jgi:hypothetical protein
MVCQRKYSHKGCYALLSQWCSTGSMECKAYSREVSGEEWALVAHSLTLMTADAPQRDHRVREVFYGLRWLVRAGAAWRMLPYNLPQDN